MLSLNNNKDTLNGDLKLSDCETHYIVKWLSGAPQASFFIGDTDELHNDIASFIVGENECTIELNSYLKYLNDVEKIVKKYGSLYHGPIDKINEVKSRFSSMNENDAKIILSYVPKDRYIRILNTKTNYAINYQKYGREKLENGEQFRNSFIGGITNISIKKENNQYTIKIKINEDWRSNLMKENGAKVKLEKIVLIFNDEVDSNMSKGLSEIESAQIFGIKYAPLLEANKDKFSYDDIVNSSTHNSNEVVRAVKNGMELSPSVLWYQDNTVGAIEQANDNSNDLENSTDDDLSIEKLFYKWISLQTKADGTLRYKSNSISNMKSALRALPRKFNVGSIYDINDKQELKDYINNIKNSDNFNEINRGFSNGWILSGLNCYELFFDEYISKKSLYEDVRKFEYKTNNKKPEQIIYYGAPGTGKSFNVDEIIKNKYPDEKDADKHSYRVIFHPDYTYGDFVGNIRPLNDENEELNYDFVPGPFTKLLKECFLNPTEDFYLVLEEINRGNAAAIFGDIFQLLDRKENGESKYSITNVDVAEYLADNPLLMQDERLENSFNSKRIWLPNNFNILCTMNTADQNVFVLDTAFKRRFSLNYVEIDFSSLKDNSPKLVEETGVFANDKKLKDVFDGSILKEYVEKLEKANMLKRNWPTFAALVNAIIDFTNKESGSEQIPEDKKLGPYFVTEDDINDREMFVNKVVYYLKQDVFKYVDICFNDSYEELYSEYASNGSTKDIFDILYIKQ